MYAARIVLCSIITKGGFENETLTNLRNVAVDALLLLCTCFVDKQYCQTLQSIVSHVNVNIEPVHRRCKGFAGS